MKSTTDLGYESSVSIYKSANCTQCPLKGMCYKGKYDRRTIEVNHKANSYKQTAKELLTSERGLKHRSMRPIEPEACFGDIKFNHGFKRFLLKSTRKVSVECGLVSLAHNLRKYVAQKTKDRDRYAQSMAGRGLVSGSLTTTSEGWMKRSGTLEEPSDGDFIRL